MRHTISGRVKEVLVKIECPICRGKGCYDCGDKGTIKEWVSIIKLVNNMKAAIEDGKGIL